MLLRTAVGALLLAGVCYVALTSSGLTRREHAAGSLSERAPGADWRQSRRGEWLRVYRWPCVGGDGHCTGGVYVVHDFGEHCGRYAGDFVERLTDEGYSVACHDHVGHGMSDGERGHVVSFADYVVDVQDRLLEAFPPRRRAAAPVFVLGHGVGANIALAWGLDDAVQRPAGFAGFVFSALSLHVDRRLVFSALHVDHRLAVALSSVLPKLRLSIELDAHALSRNASAWLDNDDDPLALRSCSAHALAQLAAAAAQLHDQLPQLRWPFLASHGSDDAVASVGDSALLVDVARSADKQLLVLPGWRHEPFSDPDRDVWYNAVLDWLAKHG